MNKLNMNIRTYRRLQWKHFEFEHTHLADDILTVHIFPVYTTQLLLTAHAQKRNVKSRPHTKTKLLIVPAWPFKTPDPIFCIIKDNLFNELFGKFFRWYLFTIYRFLKMILHLGKARAIPKIFTWARLHCVLIVRKCLQKMSSRRK